MLVGIYGVLSLSVGSRLKEIAVRKAIGAQQGDILRSVLSEAGRMILVGVVVGGVVAAAVGFGVIALFACLLPALRAARTDLVSALHQD